MGSFTRYLLAALLCMGPAAFADQAIIAIDGRDADWSTIAATHVDPAGDAGSSSIDFTTLQLADDDRFLFLRFDIGTNAQLDEFSDVVLYVDADMNATTGLSVSNIGAELEWRFGDREGVDHDNGGATIFHDDIRLRSGPTVSSPWFEVAIGRNEMLGGSALFPGSQVRLVLRDEDGTGDQLPDVGSVLYTFDIGSVPPSPPTPLDRDSTTDLRLATYNVRNDSPWEPGQEPRFGRQIAAVDADIWCFQEIYNHSATATANLVNAWTSPGAGMSWSSADNNDCIVVSRYPIANSWSLSGNLAVLIDTTGSGTGVETLVVNAHLPCCGNESGRQDEVDEILAFLRDAKTPGGAVQLAPDTVIVVTGDLNLVGESSTLESLLTGDIANEGTYGPDAAPDWDDSALTSLVSLQTEKRMAYTWRNDFSSFWPGMLDFIIYSDSTIGVANHYVLYSPEMSPTQLAQAGLIASDSAASDHLLRVADFRSLAPRFLRGDCNNDGNRDVSDPVQLLALIFLGGTVDCPSSCDTDDDGTLTVNDAVLSVQALFGLGAPIPPPHPTCGQDPTADGLTCPTSFCP